MRVFFDLAARVILYERFSFHMHKHVEIHCESPISEFRRSFDRGNEVGRRQVRLIFHLVRRLLNVMNSSAWAVTQNFLCRRDGDSTSTAFREHSK